MNDTERYNLRQLGYFSGIIMGTVDKMQLTTNHLRASVDTNIYDPTVFNIDTVPVRELVSTLRECLDCIDTNLDRVAEYQRVIIDGDNKHVE